MSVAVPDAPEPGDPISVDVEARDALFQPVTDASIDATVTSPGGETAPIKLRHTDSTTGRAPAALTANQPGLYRIRADAKRGATSLGSTDRWLYVGGADREFADPRLNEGFLRRIARNSGGRYVRAADAGRVPEWLRDRDSPERRVRTPRSLARAVGVCADYHPAFRRVDSAAMVGPPVTLLRALAATLALMVVSSADVFAGERYAVIIKGGAAGGDAYAQKYDKWRATLTSKTLVQTFGYAPDPRHRALAEAEGDGVQKATRENVQRVIGDLRKRITKDDQLLVLLIGHGTSIDGDEAKFNLVGPDLSATEWADLIRPVPGRVVFVDTTGASFPFPRQARRPRPDRPDRHRRGRAAVRDDLSGCISSRPSAIQPRTSTRTVASRYGRRSPTRAPASATLVRAERPAADRTAAARRHRRRDWPRGAEPRHRRRRRTRHLPRPEPPVALPADAAQAVCW